MGERSDLPAFDAASYAESAAAFVGLPLDDTTRPGVVASLERTAAFALLFLDDPAVAEAEPAPVFAADLASPP